MITNSNKNIYINVAGMCTDNKYFNTFGYVSKGSLMSSDKDELYSFNYTPGKLTIKDAHSFVADF